MMRGDRAAAAALTDRYFAEQCARLGPIDGVAVPTRKRMSRRATTAKMDLLAGSRTTSRTPVRGHHMVGRDHVVDGTEMIDRFRL